MNLRWLRPAIRLPAVHRRLAIAGWILYAASWVTPGVRDGQLHPGAGIFLTAIRAAFTLVFRSGSAPAIGVGALLLAGWLANFSLFVRLPAWARVLWILAPWPLLALAVHAMHGASLPGALLAVLYFFPWAVGIALIHATAMADSAGSGRSVTNPLPGHPYDDPRPRGKSR